MVLNFNEGRTNNATGIHLNKLIGIIIYSNIIIRDLYNSITSDLYII